MAFLNHDLIFKNSVTPERVYRLHLLHDLKDGVFRRAAKGVDPDRCLSRLRQIEFEMQAAWGLRAGRYETHLEIPDAEHATQTRARNVGSRVSWSLNTED